MMAIHFILILIVALLTYPVCSDHTTFCINFPNVRYADSELSSMGFHLFPNYKEFVDWTFYQVNPVNNVFPQTEADNVRHLHEYAYTWKDYHDQYPMGTLNVYMLKYKQRWLNGWYRVEFKFRANYDNDDMHSCLKMFTLKAYDDRFRRQDIGEFVWDFPPNDLSLCPSNDASKYTIISCGGASKSEPLVSNNIVILRDNPKMDGHGKGSIYPQAAEGLKILPNLKGKRTLNFYIRIPMQDCNQKQTIVFLARIIEDADCLKQAYAGYNIKKYTHRLAWAYIVLDPTKVPGVADALPTPSQAGDLDCETKISKTGLPHKFMTIFNNDQIEPENDPYLHGMHYLYGCQGEYFAGRCRLNWFDIYKEDWHGYDNPYTHDREIVNQNEAHGANIPICEHYQNLQAVNKNPIGETYYHKPKEFHGKALPFVHTQVYLKGSEKKCSELYSGGDLDTCVVTKKGRSAGGRSVLEPIGRRRHHHRHAKKGTYVKRGRTAHLVAAGRTGTTDTDTETDKVAPAETKDILSAWDGLTEEEKGFMGVPYDKFGYTQLVWGMKQGHAVIQSIIVFFVMPVHLFITRYYKESFMDRRILYSRVWYQAHVHGIFITGTLLLTSILPTMTAKRYLGTSLTEAAKLHRTIGWSAIGLFGALTLFGGFRAYSNSMRKLTISLHWLFGMIFYVLMYFLMLNGLHIPGNGISHYDLSFLLISNESDQVYWNEGFIHVGVWILFEIVMHMIMSIKIHAFDAQMKVTKQRIYLPVPIPVIKEHSLVNAAGHGLRVICLWIYISAAFLSTTVYYVMNIATRSHKWDGIGLGPMSCTHDPVTLRIRENISEDCTY